MGRYGNIILFLTMAGLFFMGPATAQAQHDYIRISDPFLRKIPIAIPLFSALEPGQTGNPITREASDLLSDTMEFTGYFKILDRKSFLLDPRKPELTVDSINFRNWTTIGAELLITGGFRVKGDTLTMDLRLLDTFKGKLLIGKRYQGGIADQRRIIRRFCGDIFNHLIGTRGIFDSKIAFVSTGSGKKEIYTCDFDGHNIRRITYNDNITMSPAWSSDGKWLAFVSYARGKPDIYIKHLRKKHGTVISRKGLNISPAWLPDEFYLAAVLSFSGDPEIYLLTGTGKIIKRLTKSWGIDVSPTWSPDGKKLAFVSNRSGSPQIYIMTVDTGQVERLTFEGGYNTSPSWSPRGDRIAYSGVENGQTNIYTITIDGRQLIQLTQNAGNNESPCWSPDGSLIAFSSTREGTARIYVMTIYGTDQRRLLTMPGAQTDPAWSPRILND
jgi:TolB protein